MPADGHDAPIPIRQKLSNERQVGFLKRARLDVAATLPWRSISRVWRWERGERNPRPHYVRLLCHLFQLPPELGLLSDPQVVSLDATLAMDRWGLDDMKRRDFLRGLAGMIGTAASAPVVFDTDPWERLTKAVREPSRIDDRVVDHMEENLTTFERLEVERSPASLIGPVLGQLETLRHLFNGGMPSSLRRRLLGLSGETAALAGWLFWDLAQPDRAASYFYGGLEAAREANDRALGAYLVGSAAVQPSYREKPQARLRLLDGRSWGFSRREADPKTGAWLWALEAEAHVLAGDSDRALRSLEEAERVAQGKTSGDPRPRTAFFNPTRLDGERGVALSRLGHSRPARDILDAAIGGLSSSETKPRPRLLAALGHALVHDHEVEQACEVAREALDLAVNQAVDPNLQDVRGLRRRLEPWRDTSPVAALDERLATVAAT